MFAAVLHSGQASGPNESGTNEAGVTDPLALRELPGPSGTLLARPSAERTFSETSTVVSETPRRAPPASTRPPVTHQGASRSRARGTSESSQRPILNSSNSPAAEDAPIVAEHQTNSTDRLHAWRHSIGGRNSSRSEPLGRLTAHFRPFRPNYQHGEPATFTEIAGPATMERTQGYHLEQALPPPQDYTTTATSTRPLAVLTMDNQTWNDLTWSQKLRFSCLPGVLKGAVKSHTICGLGELVGTTLFLFFAFAGTEVANIQASNSGKNTTTGSNNDSNVSMLLYISFAFGLSLIVNVWIFFRISGGLFNPAITFSMLLIKAISPVRAIVLVIAQMAGGMLASVIVRFLFPETFNVRTTLGRDTSLVQGVFIEAILTAEVVFTVLMLAWEKHRATPIAPVGIGLALFIAEMAGVYFTGGSTNPSRSFGPCLVTATFDREHWIYWVGPFSGSLLAVGFYKLVKLLEYEMRSPWEHPDHRE